MARIWGQPTHPVSARNFRYRKWTTALKSWMTECGPGPFHTAGTGRNMEHCILDPTMPSVTYNLTAIRLGTGSTGRGIWTH